MTPPGRWAGALLLVALTGCAAVAPAPAPPPVAGLAAPQVAPLPLPVPTAEPAPAVAPVAVPPAANPAAPAPRAAQAAAAAPVDLEPATATGPSVAAVPPPLPALGTPPASGPVSAAVSARVSEPVSEPMPPAGQSDPVGEPVDAASAPAAPALVVDRARVQRGLASWYGRPFHGRTTANGETFDMYAVTAAHRTLPMPSFARVRNPANGRELVVRINDRGPFHTQRILDLSHAAAFKLGLVGGVAPVLIEPLVAAAPANAAATASNTAVSARQAPRHSTGRAAAPALPPGVAALPPGMAALPAAAFGPPMGVPEAPSPGEATTVSPDRTPDRMADRSPDRTADPAPNRLPEPGLAPAALANSADPTPRPGAAAGPGLTAAPAPTPAVAPALVVAATAAARQAVGAMPLAPPAPAAGRPLELAGVVPQAVLRAARGFWLQLGAFRDQDGAMGFRHRLARELDELAPRLTIFHERALHWLHAGPFADRADAHRAAERLRTLLAAPPVVVERR